MQENRHVVLSQKIVILHPSTQRPLSSVPKVAVVESFNCPLKLIQLTIGQRNLDCLNLYTYSKQTIYITGTDGKKRCSAVSISCSQIKRIDSKATDGIYRVTPSSSTFQVCFSFTHLFNETASRAIYSLGLWLASDLFISRSDDSGLIKGRMSLKGNKL